MAPRAQDVQNLLVTASIHRGSYNPEPPTNPQSVLRLSRKERDRLEIYGDAILRERVVSFLFHEFPSRGAGFISTIQSALLSNHTFTNILLKAEGYSHPNGFPVDKSIADVFETMAALAYKQCPEQFEMWFSDTFVPLVNDAASLWDLADSANYAEYYFEPNSAELAPRPATPTDEIPTSVPKKSWVESCIEAASLPERRGPRVGRASEIPKKRRWDVSMDGRPEEQPVRKRRWAEAMEAAGNDVRPPQSSWVEAMARASESDPTTKLNRRQEKNAHRHDKDNCRPLPRAEPPQRKTRDREFEQVHTILKTEPPKRKSRWDVSVKVPKTFERRDSNSLASTATIREGNVLHLRETSANPPSESSRFPVPILRSKQITREPIPSAPTTSRLETTSARESYEPLRDVNVPAAVSLILPPLDCSANDNMSYDDQRAGTCTPMDMSPASSPTSPTKSLPLPSSSCEDGRYSAPDMPNLDEDERTGSLIPHLDTAFRRESNTMRRGRRDSISSTCSSMVISACSSPTKIIFHSGTPFGPNAACVPTRRGLIGKFEPSTGAESHGCPPNPTTLPAEADESKENVNLVAKESMFWPGKTVVFKYRRPLRPL